MVNRRESKVRERYEERGWQAVRGGWPDWLFVKADNGQIQDFVCVEVKSPAGRMRHNQALARKVLEEELGAEYRVEVVE